jgi:hypothetical protein
MRKPASEALDKLLPWEAVFVAEYASNGWNAAAAYRAAKPNSKATTCSTEGPRTIVKPQIRTAIRGFLTEILGTRKDTLDLRIVDMYIRRAFYNPATFVDSDGQLRQPLEAFGDDATCIEKIELKQGKEGIGDFHVVTFADRDKALEQLTKYMQLIKGDGGPDGTGVRVIVLPKSMTPAEWTKAFSMEQQAIAAPEQADA